MHSMLEGGARRRPLALGSLPGPLLGPLLGLLRRGAGALARGAVGCSGRQGGRPSRAAAEEQRSLAAERALPRRAPPCGADALAQDRGGAAEQGADAGGGGAARKARNPQGPAAAGQDCRGAGGRGREGGWEGEGGRLAGGAEGGWQSAGWRKKRRAGRRGAGGRSGGRLRGVEGEALARSLRLPPALLARRAAAPALHTYLPPPTAGALQAGVEYEYEGLEAKAPRRAKKTTFEDGGEAAAAGGSGSGSE